MLVNIWLTLQTELLPRCYLLYIYRVFLEIISDTDNIGS